MGFRLNKMCRTGKFCRDSKWVGNGLPRTGEVEGNGRVTAENVLKLWEWTYSSVNIRETADLYTLNG